MLDVALSKLNIKDIEQMNGGVRPRMDAFDKAIDETVDNKIGQRRK